MRPLLARGWSILTNPARALGLAVLVRAGMLRSPRNAQVGFPMPDAAEVQKRVTPRKGQEEHKSTHRFREKQPRRLRSTTSRSPYQRGLRNTRRSKSSTCPYFGETLWFHFTNWLKHVLTPSSPHLRSHSLHRRRRRLRLPLLRHLPRLALVGGKYRQAPSG